MNCKVCDKRLAWGNKTNLCRLHANIDPDVQAARIAKLRLAFATRPELREAQRQRMTTLNRTPQMREIARETAMRVKLWEHGAAGATPESRARGAKSIRDTRLAHIPADVRDLYIELTMKRRLTAAEAERVALEHHEASLIAFRRKLGAA